MRLKLFRVGAALSSCGREFHAVGPAYEKARSPNFVSSRGMVQFMVLAERSPRRKCRCSYSVDLLTEIGWRQSMMDCVHQCTQFVLNAITYGHPV